METLQEGRDATERLSTEVAEGVSGLVDTDRTAELLIWVWQSLTGRLTAPTEQAQQQAQQQQGGHDHLCAVPLSSGTHAAGAHAVNALR